MDDVRGAHVKAGGRRWRLVTVGAAAVAALALGIGGGAAYAYFTGHGSGTGAATTGTLGAVTLQSATASPSTALVPGEPGTWSSTSRTRTLTR